MDAALCVQHLRLEDRTEFKDALRSALVKRRRDISLFDELFDLHFLGGPLLGTVAEGRFGDNIQLMDRLAAEMERGDTGQLLPVTRMLMTGNFGELTRHMLAASGSLALRRMQFAPMLGRFFVNELRRKMGIDGVRVEAQTVLTEMERSGVDPTVVQEFREHVARNLERLEKELEKLVLDEVQRTRFMAFRRIEGEEMAGRNLYHLTDQDIAAMRPEVERLARRLKERLGLRFKRADRKQIDLRRTLRGNVGYGGPLPDIRFRNKKTTRPQVVALCDVSRSVRDFSRFMLLFLFSLKEVISRIRSFIFVGDLAEVTSVFQEYDLNEAVSRAAEGQGLKYRFGTDYGSSLGQFVAEHLGAVNSRTTVIILGDARNNNLPPRINAMEAIAERCRKVIWMNPEPVTFWGTGDSIMHLYEPHCTTLTQCGSLAQLSDAIEQNLLP
ncbi:MAG: uncharacterized protein QG577_2532 [Thermodesulfobacteriota bacterium]|nr:uncharacterized protein [Thermodesulfobacteriota bacterium]